MSITVEAGSFTEATPADVAAERAWLAATLARLGAPADRTTVEQVAQRLQQACPPGYRYLVVRCEAHGSVQTSWPPTVRVNERRRLQRLLRRLHRDDGCTCDDPLVPPYQPSTRARRSLAEHA